MRRCSGSDPHPYDSIGNLTFKAGVGAYTYQARQPHAVVKAGGDQFEYDAVGNQIVRPNEKVDYYSDRKIRSVTLRDTGKSFGFEYDAFGGKIVKYGEAGTTVFIDGIYEVDNPGSLGAEHRYHVTNGAAVVATVNRMRVNNAVQEAIQYYHHDALGSVDTLTRKDGSVIENLYFDTWGQRLNGSWGGTGYTPSSAKPYFGYTGHQHEEDYGRVNLVNMVGRHYDPRLGRFLVADSIVPDPFDSQAFNRYSYVYNSPMNSTDPSGHEPEANANNEQHGPDNDSPDDHYYEDSRNNENKETEQRVVDAERPTPARSEFSEPTSPSQEATPGVALKYDSESDDWDIWLAKGGPGNGPPRNGRIGFGSMPRVPVLGQLQQYRSQVLARIRRTSMERNLSSSARAQRNRDAVRRILFPNDPLSVEWMFRPGGPFSKVRWADKLPRYLRNKLSHIQNAISAGGMRGVSGAVSYSDAIALGVRFVGPGFRVMNNRKGLISSDGRRQVRFPSAKTGINRQTMEPYSRTGVQMNFQSRIEPQGEWSNNVHLDVIPQ